MQVKYKKHGFNPWVGKIPWKSKWQPILVFLPGEFHRQNSRELQSMGRRQLDMTEHTHSTLVQIAQEWELVTRGNRHWDEWVKTFSPVPLTSGDWRQVCWTCDQLPSGQWFNQSCLGNEGSLKTRKDRTQESFQVGEHVEMWGEWAPGEGGKLCAPSPMHFSHLAVPKLYASVINQ